ncbi:MAG: DUF5991 domain-containing protein [Sphingomonadaceae bacterium]|nr:DUF5991 domain-containing protein [Sphingomonadaceae bacterium]
MNRSFTLAALAAFGIAAPALAAPPPWVGTYVFEESLGPNLSNSVQQFVTHQLSLTAGDCRLKAQGVQTDEDIRCTAQPRGSGLELRFKSYGDGKLTNKYGTKIYEVGAPLLTLSRPGGKLTTRFQDYRVSLKTRAAGSYFRKV